MSEVTNNEVQTAAPVKKAAKKAVKKAAPKKVAKAATKKTAKKTEAKAAPVKKVADPNRLGKPQVLILQTLAKKDGLTRTEISTKTGINSGFTSLLGHLDPAQREPQSLAARGFIKIEQHDRDGKNVILFSITASGRKALEKSAAK